MAMLGSTSLIVIMTDFGTEHWYDAAMKGEILQRAPHARILDLSHNVPRHSIEQGAFILHCAVDSFPKRTIFLCVVDPGVGSTRRSLVGWAGSGWGFVGPDNGLISPLLDRNPRFTLHEIKSPMFRKREVSGTFHGRDIFAPAAARLLLGEDPRMAGPRITDPVRLPPIAAREENGSIHGKVMLIDHFGNAVTNVEQAAFDARLADRTFALTVQSLKLDHLDANYSRAEPNKALCYWGSSGFLEIAVNFGSAAESFGIAVGDPVRIDCPA